MLIELRTHERANLVKFVLIQLCVRSKGIYIVIYKKYNRNFIRPTVGNSQLASITPESK